LIARILKLFEALLIMLEFRT